MTPIGQKGAAAIYAHQQHDFTSPGGHRMVMEYREDTNDWNTLTASITEDEYRASSVEGIAYAYNLLWKHRDGDITSIPEALANIKPPLGQRVQYSRVPITELEINYIRSVRWVQREVPEYDGLGVLLRRAPKIEGHCGIEFQDRRIGKGPLAGRRARFS